MFDWNIWFWLHDDIFQSVISTHNKKVRKNSLFDALKLPKSAMILDSVESNFCIMLEYFHHLDKESWYIISG
jgi:hypothetical protein